MIRALIFDFDGLILDTETPEYEAWQAIYQSYGHNLPLDKWVTLIGSGGEQERFDPHGYLEEQVKRSLDREALNKTRRTHLMEVIAGKPVLPGVEHYLAEAKRLGLKVGLASSSGDGWVQGHLTRLGLMEHFECIRCAGDVKHTKPEPDLYLAVLEAFDVRPHEAIALEDSVNGLTAAKRAGMWGVAVPNAMTRGLNFDQADLRLNSLAEMELADMIQEFSRKEVL